MALTDRVRIVSVLDGCGGTLTNASISGLTPSVLEGYGKTEHNKARVIAEAVEARTIGVIPKTMHELLFSRITEIGKSALSTSKIPGMQSVILPYSYRNRRTNIGAAVFAISSGGANSDAGTTVSGVVYPTSAWDIVVNTGPSPWASDLTNLHRYFLPGEFLYVEGIVVGTGAKRVTPLRIVTASTSGGGVTTVTVAANRTAAWWSGATNDEKAVYQPTHGVVSIGTNAINDYESWCHNQPSELSRSLIVDWHQDSRYTQCFNDVYEATLSNILAGGVNDIEKNYQWLSLKEQNAQQRKLFEDKWANDIFFGDIIDETQSNPNNYTTLPPVVDPEDGTVYGYKTRAKGLRTLLAEESRVVDLAGGPLDLDVIFAGCYDIMRNRKADGGTVEVIDLMTDKDTALVLHQVFVKYHKDMLGHTTVSNSNVESGKVIDQTTGLVRYKYNRYQLVGQGFDIAVFVDEFFTDRVLNFGNGSGGAQGSVNFRNSGRSIWAIDWSDFNLGVAGTNSVKREYKGKITAEANALWSCVMAMNTKHYDLRRTTWCTQIGDAKRHWIIENFNITQPVTFTLNSSAPGYESGGG
jgi:hypothetical protein